MPIDFTMQISDDEARGLRDRTSAYNAKQRLSDEDWEDVSPPAFLRHEIRRRILSKFSAIERSLRVKRLPDEYADAGLALHDAGLPPVFPPE